LGRGFLADLSNVESLPENDSRATHPRFSGDNLEENKNRIRKFYEIARRKGCTPAQLALAWLHSQGEDVFPIPGTKSSKRIEENAGAFRFSNLTEEEKKEIEDSARLVGERNAAGAMATNYQNRL